MENKKYEFTGETKTCGERTMHQICAIRDFSDIKAGDIGGWIEKDGNLSQDDDAWVCGNAQVCGDAWVYGKHHLWTSPRIGSRNGVTTFYRGAEGKIFVVCGCFHNTIEKFEERVKITHGNNQHAQDYEMAIQMAKIWIDLENDNETKN